MNTLIEEYEIISFRLKMLGGMRSENSNEEHIFDINGNITHSIESDVRLFDSGENIVEMHNHEMTNELFRYLKRVDFYNKFREQLYDGPISHFTDVSSCEIEFGFHYRTEIYDLKNIEISTIRNLYNKILRIMGKTLY